jgi:hypothetical protein
MSWRIALAGVALLTHLYVIAIRFALGHVLCVLTAESMESTISIRVRALSLRFRRNSPMSAQTAKIDAFLRSKGIDDCSAFLAGYDETADVRMADSPFVNLRGSVHLMLKRIISRGEVNERLARLKHV